MHGRYISLEDIEKKQIQATKNLKKVDLGFSRNNHRIFWLIFPIIMIILGYLFNAKLKKSKKL